MGNDQYDQLVNTVANGQPHYEIHFRGAHKHLGHWTWHGTVQLDAPNPPKTMLYANLKHVQENTA
jgi:hypothetical protein